MPIRLKNSSANGSPFSKLAGSQSSPYSLAIASSNSSSVIFSRSSLLIFIASYNIFDRFRTDAALAVDLPFPALLIMWIYGSELLRGGLLFSNEKELFQFILFVHWSSCLHYTISDLTLHYFIGIPPRILLPAGSLLDLLCPIHSGKRLVFRLFACYSHRSMEYGNHTAHAVWMDWQLRELIFRENALAHSQKVCMGTGRKCHRMDGGSKVST